MSSGAIYKYIKNIKFLIIYHLISSKLCGTWNVVENGTFM